MALYDPLTIKVLRDERQRRNIDDASVEEMALSLTNRGQIQPGVVRRDGEDLVLVVGETRLLGCIKAGLQFEASLWEDLSPREARFVELEENIKRKDLPWEDRTRAIGMLHEELCADDPEWSQPKTSEKIGLSYSRVRIALAVWRQLDSTMLKEATSMENAYAILERHAERRAASIVSELISAGNSTFGPTPSPLPLPSIPPAAAIPSLEALDGTPLPSEPATPLPLPEPLPLPAPITPSSFPNSILAADFISWVADYSGPKFNLVHCDFPYGKRYEAFAHSVAQRGDDLYDSSEETYWKLLNSFCENLDKFASYSSHVMFWFNMDFYTQTKMQLEKTGLWVQAHPLVWFKSDNAGIVPGRDAQYTRRVYETAFLCSRGKRPLLKAIANCYPSPLPSGANHPSQKSEPALRHFFSGLVDSTTDMFDPTAGSGAALRAAEDCGARSVLGLEIDPTTAAAANTATNQRRYLRRLTQ